MKPFDASGALVAVGEGSELRQLAIQGAGVSVFSQGTVFAVQMVATVVLARLLTPADFGVVTMVTTFSLLLISFGLNGFTEGVLQREQIGHSLASNLFWISVSVGLLLTIGFALCGSLLARFYGNPHVEHVAVGLSVTIFLSSASVLHLALLKRAMRFSAVSANSVVAQAFSVAVSILLGLAGWGYWALVAGNVTLHLSTCIGAWSLCRWVPGFPRRMAGTAAMVRFAMNVYSHFIVSYIKGNMDNLLVGWRFGAQSLGFYKKAFDLFVLPANQLLSPVAPVAISTLSRVNRDLVQYRRYFLSGLSILAFLGMGVGADLTLVGKDLIRLMLGTQWGASGRIFAFFGPGIGVMLVYGTHGWIHLSIGRAGALVPVGRHRACRNSPTLRAGTAMGPCGNRCSLDSVVVDPNHPRVLVRWEANKLWRRTDTRGRLEIPSCIAAGRVRLRRDHPEDPLPSIGVWFRWRRITGRDCLFVLRSFVSWWNHLVARRVCTLQSGRCDLATLAPMG